MKHLKKIMALVIACVMVIGTMSMGSVFGAAGDQKVDATISITGLDKGDTVNLYKVLEWTDGVGWTFAPGFEALTTDATDTHYSAATASENVQKLVNNEKGVQLTDADMKAIATLARNATAVDSKVLDSTTYSYDTFKESPATNKPGMYVALVQPITAGTVYNPIVVSADFTSTNTTNTIPASSAINGTAVAKKKNVTVEKTEPKITNDVGDTYNFTVKTTIPVYSTAFEDTFFEVSDKLSDHLDLVASSIKINNMTLADFVASLNLTGVTTADYSLEAADKSHKFVLRFEDKFIKALESATDITITYDAKLNCPVDKLTNVTEENNEITVKFPNDPNDKTGKKVTAIKDDTREYTFTIDGSLFGNESWRTAELVKIGLDENDSPIEAEIEVSNGSKHAALAGATFGLFKTKEQADAYTATTTPADSAAAASAGFYTNDVFPGYVVTDSQGLMKMEGLDVGKYWLKELDAPDGYIRDQKSHEVEITAVIDKNPGEKITEWYTVDANGAVTWHKSKVADSIEYTYYVPVLKSYTITIDGKKSSTYTMELSGPAVSSVTPAESSTDIVNTKGVELPSTGGIGTTIFYIIGAILVVGAGVLLVTRRRMGEE